MSWTRMTEVHCIELMVTGGLLDLAAAKDHKTLLATMQQQCQWNPDMIYNFIEDEHLAPLFSRPEFQKLRDRYLE